MNVWGMGISLHMRCSGPKNARKEFDVVAAFTFKHVPLVVVMIVKLKGRFVRSGVEVYRFEPCAIMALRVL